ncbi:glycosyltransferase [Streptomyces achromogenes]|uniref:glycosyltransferase n=1 Tax=Streptomyces achromogenes TaxID=67255 RepID=UPI003A809DE0
MRTERTTPTERAEGPVTGTGPDGIVVIVDQCIPRPDQDSGSVRLSRVIDQLRELRRPVLFCPLDGQAPEPYATRLREQGVALLRDPAQQRRFLREQGHRIALALLCRPQPAIQLLGDLRDHAPHCRVVYDTVDVHFRRLSRQADLSAREGRADRFTLRAQAEATRALELLLVRESDTTLVVSDEERRLLTSLVPEADVRVLSNIHSRVGTGAPPAPGARVLFVGHYLHAPNVDAAQWLARDIMPLVRREVPEATLDLVGSAAPEAVTALAGQGVVVHGWVEDLAPLYARARVAVAPLRYGAGVKGKVGQALEYGVPVAGTSIAFEGMGLVHDRHVLAGDTARDLAGHIVRLVRDDELCARLTRAAAGQLAARFGPAHARAVLDDLLSPRATPPRADRPAVRI